MKKIVNPFNYNLDEIDLHGETTDTCVYLIESFIRDQIKLKNERAIIIHGKGSGLLKKKTQEVLKRNKNVKNYYIDGWNDGQTIIELKINK